MVLKEEMVSSRSHKRSEKKLYFLFDRESNFLIWQRPFSLVVELCVSLGNINELFIKSIKCYVSLFETK